MSVLSVFTEALPDMPSVLVLLVKEYIGPPSIIVIYGERRGIGVGEYLVGNWFFQLVENFFYEELSYEYLMQVDQNRRRVSALQDCPTLWGSL